MKYLILVGDGMGDYPVPELGGKTPLEVAKTPMIDQLCRKGDLFLNRTVPEGYPPGSDVANMSLMGYDPARYYTGRAPLEAAALGIELADDEIAFRCNMVTLDHGQNGQVIMRDFSAGHIGNEESHLLVNALNESCNTDRFRFHPGVGYRHLMVLKGEHPGFKTVPPHDYIEQEVTDFYNRYLQDKQWQQLLDTTKSIFAEHPVNRARLAAKKNPATLVWLWGEGKMPAIPLLTRRFNISGSMISAVDLLKGLGILAGLDSIDVPGATGFIDTNYEGKAGAAIDALKTGDFVFVHLEGPDEAGHQGSLENKITAIEDFDSRIVTPIVRNLEQHNKDFRLVITMDHFTPLALRTHVSDPVPTLLYDSREPKQGSDLPYNEKSCQDYSTQHDNDLEHGHTMIDKLFAHHN